MLSTAIVGRSVPRLVEQLRDERSHEVVFLSHCLLDQSTRYLGGAGRRGSVQEVVGSWMARGVGIVQLPCPEREVWGGVLKRRMLWLYGVQRRHPRLGRLVLALLPVVLWYVRARYRRIARRIAAEIEDYVRAGFTVVGVVGIDGSPSCGIRRRIDARGFVDSVAAIDPATLTLRRHDELVRRHAQPGRGMFVEALERALAGRRLEVPLLAHDLFAELACRSAEKPA